MVQDNVVSFEMVSSPIVKPSNNELEQSPSHTDNSCQGEIHIESDKTSVNVANAIVKLQLGIFKELQPPKDRHKLFFKGKGRGWLTCYLVWAICASLAMLGSLLWYFLYDSCKLENSIVDLGVPAARGFWKTFNEDGLYICGSHVLMESQTTYYGYYTSEPIERYGLACVLPQLKCSEYATYFPERCLNSDTIDYCDDSFLCPQAETANAGGRENIASPTVSIDYLVCGVVADAIVDSVNYTFAAQTVIVFLFLMAKFMWNYYNSKSSGINEVVSKTFRGGIFSDGQVNDDISQHNTAKGADAKIEV